MTREELKGLFAGWRSVFHPDFWFWTLPKEPFVCCKIVMNVTYYFAIDCCRIALWTEEKREELRK